MIPRAGMQSNELTPVIQESKQKEQLDSSVQIKFLHNECDDGFIAIDIDADSDADKADETEISISVQATHPSQATEESAIALPLWSPPFLQSPSLDDRIGQLQDNLLHNMGKLIGTIKPKQFTPTLEPLPEHGLLNNGYDSTAITNAMRKRTPNQIEEDISEDTPLITSPSPSPKNKDSSCSTDSNFSFSRFRNTLFGNNCLQIVGKFFEDCLRPSPDLDGDNAIMNNDDDIPDVLALNYMLYR